MRLQDTKSKPEREKRQLVQYDVDNGMLGIYVAIKAGI